MCTPERPESLECPEHVLSPSDEAAAEGRFLRFLLTVAPASKALCTTLAMLPVSGSMNFDHLPWHSVCSRWPGHWYLSRS